MRRRGISIGLVLLGLSGCENYELPPRVLGVSTEACPDCEILDLSEARVEPGSISIDARFEFVDEWGSVERVWVYVTDPSGRVLSPTMDDAGLDCRFVSSLGEEGVVVTPGTCDVTSARANTEPPAPGDGEAEGGGNANDGSLLGPFGGIERAPVTARFGVLADEIGEWTVEVEVERSTGARSNRISATFEVAEGIVE